MHFPACEAPAEEAAAPGKIRPVILKGHGERVLLVDDEPLVREVAEALLEQLGYRVLSAENGEQALTMYREQGSEIDLVLMDMMMPRMNGDEAIRRLRQIDADVKVIISTGDPAYLDGLPGIKAAAVGMVNKPYTIDALSSALAKALGAS